MNWVHDRARYDSPAFCQLAEPRLEMPGSASRFSTVGLMEAEQCRLFFEPSSTTQKSVSAGSSSAGPHRYSGFSSPMATLAPSGPSGVASQIRAEPSVPSMSTTGLAPARRLRALAEIGGNCGFPMRT